jgi:hypothetical protein
MSLDKVLEDEVVEDTGESQVFNLLNPEFVDFDTCLDPITNELPTSGDHSQKERVERVRAILWVNPFPIHDFFYRRTSLQILYRVTLLVFFHKTK